MFSFESPLFSGSSTLSKRVAFGVLSGIGVALAAAFLFDAYVDWFLQENPLWSTVLENSMPALLALTLPYVGWRLFRGPSDSIYLSEAAKWTLVGCVGMSVLSGLVVGVHVFQEEIKPVIVILQITAVGAIAGLWVGNNIARVKEAEGKAEEDRDRLANLLEGLPAPVVHGRFEGDRLDVLTTNAAFDDVFGQEVEEAVGKDLYDLVVPEGKREEAAEIDRQAIEEGVAEKEVRRPTTEGTRDFWLRVSQALDEGASETYAIYTDITERKESRRRLERYRAYTDRLLNAIDDLFFALDKEAQFQRWNDSIPEVTGYSDEEIEGMSAFDLVPEGERERVAGQIADIFRTGSGQIEVPLLRKDGTTVPYEFIGNLVDHPEGGLRMVGMGRDITGRRRRKRELERQNDLFEKAQKIANVGAWEYDLQAEEITLTDQAYRVHGLAPGSDMTPERSHELYHPEDRPTAQKAFRRAIEEGEPYDVEARLITEEGDERWIRTRGDPQREEGEVVRVRGAIQNVTGRKKREKKLQQTTARLSALYENSPDMINIHDPEGTIIDPNPRFLEKTGYGREEVQGMKVWEIDEQIDPDEAAALWERMETGDRVELEGTYRRQDGSVFPVEIHVRKLDLVGEDRFMAISRDITKRKEAKNELKETIRFYEQVLEQAPIDLAVFTPEAEFEYVNSRSMTDPDRREWLLGRTNEEYCRKRGLDPEIGRRRDAAIREAAEAKRRTEHEEILDTDEGPRHYLRVHGPVTDGDGRVTQVAAFGLDITERKRYAWALEERQEKVEALYEAIEHLLVATSSDAVGERIHDLLTKAFDFPLLGVSLVEEGAIVPHWIAMEEEYELPPVQPLAVAGESLGAQALRSGEVIVENDLPGVQNEIDYGDLQSAACVPIGERGILYLGHVETGRFDTFDLHLLDVLATHATVVFDRIDREKRLRERRRKIEVLYEATSRLLGARSRTDVSDRIHDVLQEVFEYPLSNTGFLEGALIAPEKTTTHETLQVPPPTPQPRDGDTVSARALRAGETVVVEEVEALDNDVDYGGLSSIAGVAIGDHGVIVVGQEEDQHFDPFNLRLIEVLASYAALVLDRLDREDELLEAKKEAEEAAHLKSAMLANMSHEIRTPLTSITGFSEILQENLEGKLEVFATKIHEGSQRLQRTLDSILHLSKLEAEAHELDRKELSLEEIVEKVVEELGQRAGAKSLTVTTSSPSTPAVGHWNEDAVHRICRNLLENAIKFTPEGGQVDLQVSTEDGAAVLEVEDTGIGMDPGAVDELFEAFKQESEGLDREFEGSGLGLSIVKRLTDELGGTVEVETEKGEGTCFAVRLPTTGGEKRRDD